MIITIKEAVMTGNILQGIRRWWRPLTCLGIAGTMFTHGMLIPIYNTIHQTGTATDLNGLSLLITAIAGTFAVREWGKAKGNE